MTEIKPRTWWGLVCALLLVLSFIYFKDLDVRPMHNDEGVNAVFLQKLIESNNYRYNPNNFHGPSLYYFHVVPTWVSRILQNDKNSLSEITLRVPIVLTAFLIFMGMTLLRKRIGRWGVFLAILLAGFSVNNIFFLRYFIHEVYFVLFTFGIYLSMLFWMEKRKIVYFYLFLVCTILLFCTKETSVIHYFILGFSLFCAEWTRAFISKKHISAGTKESLAQIKSFFPSQKNHLLFGSFMVVAIWATLYSSFFSNLDGLKDSFLSYVHWGSEGVKSGHNKRFLYYVNDILFGYEGALTFFTFIGLILAFIKNERFGLYLAFWTLGTIGAYSVIPYKTPWLVVNFILPMALLSGYGFQIIINWVSESKALPNKKVALNFVLGLSLMLSLVQVPQALRINFVEYDEPKHPPVYQHTDRHIYKLISDIEEIATKSGEGKELAINVVTRDYWPLPYYLRNYKEVNYWGQFNNIGAVDRSLVIANQKDRQKIKGYLNDEYVIRNYKYWENYRVDLHVSKKINDKIRGIHKKLPEKFASQNVIGKIEKGLRLEVYGGNFFNRRPFKRIYGEYPTDFIWNTDQEKRWRSPFSMKWAGYIKILESGEYGFSLNSDDGSHLYINGYEVIDNGGNHPPTKKSNSVYLEKGYHKIEIRYFDWLGEAVFAARWIPPGGIETGLPSDLLFHVKP